MVKGDFVGWGDEGTPTEVEGINAPLNNYNQMNCPAIVVINIFRIYWTYDVGVFTPTYPNDLPQGTALTYTESEPQRTAVGS